MFGARWNQGTNGLWIGWRRMTESAHSMRSDQVGKNFLQKRRSARNALHRHDKMATRGVVQYRKGCLAQAKSAAAAIAKFLQGSRRLALKGRRRPIQLRLRIQWEGVLFLPTFCWIRWPDMRSGVGAGAPKWIITIIVWLWTLWGSLKSDTHFTKEIRNLWIRPENPCIVPLFHGASNPPLN